jgi:hypothetical protein
MRSGNYGVGGGGAVRLGRITVRPTKFSTVATHGYSCYLFI